MIPPRMITWCFILYCLDKYPFDDKAVVSVCKGRQNSTCVEEHFVDDVSYGPWTQQLAAPLAARRTDTHEAGPSPAGRKQTHKWWGELRFWSHTNCSGGSVSLLSLSEALVFPKLGAAGGRSIWMHPAGMLRWLQPPARNFHFSFNIRLRIYLVLCSLYFAGPDGSDLWVLKSCA